MPEASRGRGRPARGDSAATRYVNVRFTEAELEALDATRGGRSRSGFIRDLIAKRAKRRRSS